MQAIYLIGGPNKEPDKRGNITSVALIFIGVAACGLLSLFNLLTTTANTSGPSVWQAMLFVCLLLLGFIWLMQRNRRRGR